MDGSLEEGPGSTCRKGRGSGHDYTDFSRNARRHRVLDVLRSLQMRVRSVIVETDETCLRHSEQRQIVCCRKPRRRGNPAKKRGLSREQVRVVIARDRERRTVAEVASRGSPSTRAITDALKAVVDVGSTLCTDASSAYDRFCRRVRIDHQPLNARARRRVRGSICHIQNANRYRSRLRKWMLRFDRVATKYLCNFLRRYRFLDGATGLDLVTSGSRMVTGACRTLA